MSHSHNHSESAECKHESIKFCQKCSVAYCESCGKEFRENTVVYSPPNYVPYPNITNLPWKPNGEVYFCSCDNPCNH